MLTTYTFTITLNPIEFGAIFVQVLYVLFAFLMATKELHKDGKLGKLHLVLAAVPFVIGYIMDLLFSLVMTLVMYLDRYRFKARTFAGKPWKEKIKQALNYIGDFTFTFQSSWHYRPGEALNGWLAKYRHKVAAFWAMLLNPWEKDHVK